MTATPMAPWTDPAVAEALHAGWTTDPRNVADLLRLVAAVRAEVEPQSLLDYGCGTGRLSAHFGAHAYLGYDTAPAMLDVARREFPSHTFTDRLAPGRKFDVVVCNGVTQYQPDSRWLDVLRDVASRARVAALVETYDGPEDHPVVTGNGCGASVVCRTVRDYMNVLAEFGTVERRVFALGEHPATHDLALYVVRP